MYLICVVWINIFLIKVFMYKDNRKYNNASIWGTIYF